MEAVVGDSISVIRRKQKEPIQTPDLVLILSGPFKGRWLRVRKLLDGPTRFVYVQVPNSEKDTDAFRQAKARGMISELAMKEHVTYHMDPDGYINPLLTPTKIFLVSSSHLQ